MLFFGWEITIEMAILLYFFIGFHVALGVFASEERAEEGAQANSHSKCLLISLIWPIFLLVKITRKLCKRRAKILLCLCLLLAPATAEAFCFEEAGRIYGVPPRLLWAIAKVESNFNPTAINENSNGSVDYGLMQINSWWVEKGKLTQAQWHSLGDPCTNVKTGAWVLAQCLRQHGEGWQGIGCYNAMDPKKRRAYAKKVFEIIAAASIRDRSMRP